MIEQAIKYLAEGTDLDEAMTYGAMNRIMEGTATDVQIAAFLIGLRVKGETAEEMTGGARSLADKCIRIRPRVPFCVDPVGTGGDRTGTFNISSTAAIVASAAGACVAKHGNRSVSSKSGSADLYEALGINIQLSPRAVETCIEELGFGFMFAPVFHPAMRFAAPVRKQLGVRTLFNLLGPLSNPASANGQVLGVYDRRIMPFVARTMINLGVSRVMIIHGCDGSDEITTVGETAVTEIRDGLVSESILTPEMFGLSRRTLSDIQGGTPEENARITLDILDGHPGPARDITLLNAAATIYVGQAASSMAEGVALAAKAIDSGAARDHLNRIVAFTRRPGIGGTGMTTGTILDRIAEKKQARVASRKAIVPMESVMERALAMPSPGFRFRQAIDRKDRMSLIAEVKKASPSKGLICRSFDPVRRAVSYEQGGAQAISVLTEEDFFLGRDEHLSAIAQRITLPLLRKDFVVDEYQIVEARALGASAILLIAALLDDNQAAQYLELSESLGLDVLFEVHDLPELVRAIELDAKIIGINNRDLRTFQVDLSTTARLARIVPASRLVVSESGIATPEDLAAVYAAGARCALVGETLMRGGEETEAVRLGINRLLENVPS